MNVQYNMIDKSKLPASLSLLRNRRLIYFGDQYKPGGGYYKEDSFFGGAANY